MQKILDVAIHAARSAGEFILRAQQKDEDLQIRDKGDRDYVTRLDELSEQHIVEIIHALFPHHVILAEESYRASLEDNTYGLLIRLTEPIIIFMESRATVSLLHMHSMGTLYAV